MCRGYIIDTLWWCRNCAQFGFKSSNKNKGCSGHKDEYAAIPPSVSKKNRNKLDRAFCPRTQSKAVQSCNQKAGKREKNRGASAERPVRRWRPGSKDGHGAHAHVFESASAHSQQHALARRGVSYQEGWEGAHLTIPPGSWSRPGLRSLRSKRR